MCATTWRGCSAGLFRLGEKLGQVARAMLKTRASRVCSPAVHLRPRRLGYGDAESALLAPIAGVGRCNDRPLLAAAAPGVCATLPRLTCGLRSARSWRVAHLAAEAVVFSRQ
jgi:hypothetical protein